MRLRLLLTLMCSLLLGASAFDQRGMKAGRPRIEGHPGRGDPARRGGKAELPNRKAERLKRTEAPRNFEKWNEMSEEGKRKALEKLPPDRREQVRRQLERKTENINNLPEAERERLFDRYQKLIHLPPERQNQIRRSYRQYQELPEDRKQGVHQELDDLSKMPEAERRARINSEEFRSKYTLAEQQMMQDLAEIPK